MLRRSESTNGIKTSKERLRFNTQFFVRQTGRPREFTEDPRARLLTAVTLRTEGASGNFHPKLGFDVLYDGRPGAGTELDRHAVRPTRADGSEKPGGQGRRRSRDRLGRTYGERERGETEATVSKIKWSTQKRAP